MASLLPTVAALKVALPLKLRFLQLVARQGAQGRTPLCRWGQQHPEISAQRGWYRRAWWGLAAGEVLRAHLYDENRCESALKLFDEPDWSEFDAVRLQRGVILVTAHLGPPKALMNYLIAQKPPLCIWTNTQDLPGWLRRASTVTFLDPLVAAERSTLLVNTALHLRDGGVLFGACDVPSGARTIDMDRLGMRWNFSLGIPALARQLNIPTYAALALWRGNRIRIELKAIPHPARDVPEEDWHRLWLESLWSLMENVIRSSPENLRFLLFIDNGAMRRELGL